MLNTKKQQEQLARLNTANKQYLHLIVIQLLSDQEKIVGEYTSVLDRVREGRRLSIYSVDREKFDHLFYDEQFRSVWLVIMKADYGIEIM